jgi:hypothetical protein
MNVSITATLHEPAKGERDSAGSPAALARWGGPQEGGPGGPEEARRRLHEQLFRPTPLSSTKRWTRMEKRHDDGSFT